MPLLDAPDADLWKLADELKMPFRERDIKWPRRRAIRFRRLEGELKSLPLNVSVSDTALMVYQTEVPNQEAHKRVKRLTANPTSFEVIVYDSDPEVQKIGQELEDGVKGLFRWMNQGKVSFDWLSTEYQQGDGLGIGKIEYIPGHGDVLAAYDPDRLEEDNEEEEGNPQAKARNMARGKYRDTLKKYKEDDGNRETKAYNDVTDAALQKERPPFRLVAVDPLTCYWWEDDDGIEVIAEIGTKPLNPLLSALNTYGVKLLGDNRLYVDPGGTDVAGRTAPDLPSSADLSQKVKYIEIRTRYQVAILIEHPKITGKAPKKAQGDRGIVLRFDNPFAPYTTGYALIPGDVTGESSPEDMYQPPILAQLATAQQQNVLTTARLSAAVEGALSPPYIEIEPEQMAPPSEEDKTPTVSDSREVPMVPGRMRRLEAPLAALDDIDERLTQDMAGSMFQDALEGAAPAAATGHRLAIQVAQADIQLVPYQNARAQAIKELMKGVVYAIKKHGLTVYIPTIPGGPRTDKGKLRVAEYAKLTPEMADLDFELIVNLGAETPVTKFAKWQALEEREAAGSIGWETLIEQSDVENPNDEKRRIFVGKGIKATMEAFLPIIPQVMLARLAQKFPEVFPQEGEGQQGGQPPPENMPMGAPPESGMANGGGQSDPMDPQNATRVPGVHMPVVQSTPDTGVPEGAELGSQGY